MKKFLFKLCFFILIIPLSIFAKDSQKKFATNTKYVKKFMDMESTIAFLGDCGSPGMPQYAVLRTRDFPANSYALDLYSLKYYSNTKEYIISFDSSMGISEEMAQKLCRSLKKEIYALQENGYSSKRSNGVLLTMGREFFEFGIYNNGQWQQAGVRLPDTGTALARLSGIGGSQNLEFIKQQLEMIDIDN